ncbi:MAG: hypothetical protein ACK4K5_06245 [Thermosynechococcus sp.]|uniref:hypothetical protein n=1 Tax=Thermosynechococcus sp. TaxID=2814275 RepID=UPI00391AE723
MSISPVTRYYLRRLLAEHPAIQSYVNRDTHPLGIEEEYLECYIHLDHLTYPQISRPTAADGMTTLGEYYQYFQKINGVASRYLGEMLTKNYWLATRPTETWLTQISVADFQSAEVPANSRDQVLTSEQRQALERWICGFIRQCSRFLPVLPTLLLNAGIPACLLCNLVNWSDPDRSTTERAPAGLLSRD